MGLFEFENSEEVVEKDGTRTQVSRSRDGYWMVSLVTSESGLRSDASISEFGYLSMSSGSLKIDGDRGVARILASSRNLDFTQPFSLS